MESTAQYRKPVWEALERYWKPIREKREGAGRRSGTLHLAQAQSNRAPRGRKRVLGRRERYQKVRRGYWNHRLSDIALAQEQLCAILSLNVDPR
jgi:hypothetical protein